MRKPQIPHVFYKVCTLSNFPVYRMSLRYVTRTVGIILVNGYTHTHAHTVVSNVCVCVSSPCVQGTFFVVVTPEIGGSGYASHNVDCARTSALAAAIYTITWSRNRGWTIFPHAARAQWNASSVAQVSPRDRVCCGARRVEISLFCVRFTSPMLSPAHFFVADSRFVPWEAVRRLLLGRRRRHPDAAAFQPNTHPDSPTGHLAAAAAAADTVDCRPAERRRMVAHTVVAAAAAAAAPKEAHTVELRLSRGPSEVARRTLQMDHLYRNMPVVFASHCGYRILIEALLPSS